MPVASSIPRLALVGAPSHSSAGSSPLALAPTGRQCHSSAPTLPVSSCAASTEGQHYSTYCSPSCGASPMASSVVGSSVPSGRSIAVALPSRSTSSPAANGHMTSTADCKLPSGGGVVVVPLTHTKMTPASLLPSPSQRRQSTPTTTSTQQGSNLPISSTSSMLILNDHSFATQQQQPQQQQCKMRLTKSQSMKFDSRLQQPTTPQQSNLLTGNSTTTKRGALEPSKSLDFLSLAAKMPGKLSTALNNNGLDDGGGDRSSSCSESTASLGLLSNLNDTTLMTPTVNDPLAINSDGEVDDDDDDQSSLASLGAHNLAVIEESPAPSLDSNAMIETKLDGLETSLPDEKLTDVAKVEEECSRAVVEEENEEEVALMSLDSIEINELPEPLKEEQKVPKQDEVKETKVNGKAKPCVAAKVNTRLNEPSKPTSLYNGGSKTMTKRPEVSRPPSRNAKFITSSKSSQPSSRASTPAFSESEPSSLSSNASNVSRNMTKQRAALQSRTTPSIRPFGSQTGAFKKPAPVNGTASTYRSNTTTATGTSGATSSLAMKRSTTYTRALNTQSTFSSRSTTTTNAKPNEARKNNTTTATTVPTGGKSFTRPTTSYLKKTTTAIITPSRLATSAQPKRPSSVASNSSTSSATKSTISSSLKSSASGAKRSPTITLLSSVASPGSRSGQSSRRSSISSPSTNKPTLANQLQHYEQLCLAKSKRIHALEDDLRHSMRQNEAILALFAFMLQEYSPLDTPHLRSELAALHRKCCDFNRDYELAKEALFQKETELDALTQQATEANRIANKLRAEIESVEAERVQIKSQFDQLDGEKKQLEAKLAETVEEAAKEKEAKSAALARLEHLEQSLKADKKYREFKEKCSNLEKEVESLNVVVEMKMQRIRVLDSEKMKFEMEMAEYESLKEAHQQLKRENEALTETLKMKARKNAEQSRDLDHLRAELKRETKEKKQFSIRNDQLEYQLNETRELLNEMSSFHMDITRDENQKEETVDTSRFTPLESNTENRFRSFHRSGKNVRRLFSTPSMTEMKDAPFESRHHFAHQTPAFFQQGSRDHHLPELVLSSIGKANSRANSSPSDHFNGPKHSSPVASPKHKTESSRRPSQ